jgi:hypothetical protein
MKAHLATQSPLSVVPAFAGFVEPATSGSDTLLLPLAEPVE